MDTAKPGGVLRSIGSGRGCCSSITTYTHNRKKGGGAHEKTAYPCLLQNALVRFTALAFGTAK